MQNLTERVRHAHTSWQWMDEDRRHSVTFPLSDSIMESVKAIHLDIVTNPAIRATNPPDVHHFNVNNMPGYVNNKFDQGHWIGFSVFLRPSTQTTFSIRYTIDDEKPRFRFWDYRRDTRAKGFLFGLMYIPNAYYDWVFSTFRLTPPSNTPLFDEVSFYLRAILDFFDQTCPTLRNNVYVETDNMREQVGERVFEYKSIHPTAPLVIYFGRSGKIKEWMIGIKDVWFWWQRRETDEMMPEGGTLTICYNGALYTLMGNVTIWMPRPMRSPV